MPSQSIYDTAIIVKDMGYREDSRYPGTGAHYYVADFRGQRLYLADPQDRLLAVGDKQKIVERPGTPPCWSWDRGRSFNRFNPSLDVEKASPRTV